MELREHGIWRFWMPLALVVVGVVALLANLNLAPGAIYRLALLWPVILIFIGTELLIRRFLAGPAAIIVSVVVIVALLAGSAAYALFGRIQPAGGSGSLDATAGRQGWDRATLVLNIGAAKVDVSSGELGDDLYRIHIDYPVGGLAPQVTTDREAGEVTVQDRPQPWFWPGPSGRDQIRVLLNPTLAWSIRVAGGTLSGRLDLSQLKLKEANLSGGANSISLSLPAPLGTIPINVSGGANHVSLHVLHGTAASIESTGGANSLTVSGRTVFSGLGDQSWHSDNFDSAPDRYRVEVSGGANTISYDETPA